LNKWYKQVELEFRRFLVEEARGLELGWGRYDLSKI
jgi:hypothetical protein